MEKSLDTLRAKAISDLEATIDTLDEKRQRLLSYWISDYSRFLRKENSFDPTSLITYKRGSIVKVHLGFRVGSEEGGLHYAVVVDHNKKSSPVTTVIPLTSVKPGIDVNNLHPSRIYLGDEIYLRLNEKLNEAQSNIVEIQKGLTARMKSLQASTEDSGESLLDQRVADEERRITIEGIKKVIADLESKFNNIQKMRNEISKMKHGSIALVGQIVTISKIRIYDPLYPNDVLTNIRLSDLSMDKIDSKLVEMFTKH